MGTSYPKDMQRGEQEGWGARTNMAAAPSTGRIHETMSASASTPHSSVMTSGLTENITKNIYGRMCGYRIACPREIEKLQGRKREGVAGHNMAAAASCGRINASPFSERESKYSERESNGWERESKGRDRESKP